ncbi:HIT domain-containing protein, partial [Patescibacteria group bacterium]|nr:HIT domain-containing protein [Patescibacteria group bacterium]
MECLFCKIAHHQQEVDLVYENEEFIVINDIHPQAPIHLLIIPKK